MPKTTVSVRNPGDLLTAVPYMVGYVPTDSLVIVALTGSRVQFLQRLDLTAARTPDGLAALAAQWARGSVSRVVVVVYSDTDPAAQRATLDAVTALAMTAGVEVSDGIVVSQDRYYSPQCGNPACCPVDGTPVPDPADTTVAAEYVGHGCTVATSADHLHRLIQTGPQATQVARHITARRAPSLSDAAAAWTEIVTTSTGVLDPATAATALLALEHVAWRDGLIAWLTPGTLSRDQLDPDVQHTLDTLPIPQHGMHRDDPLDARQVLERLLLTCRAAPAAHAAPILTVTASLAWWLGNGVLARMATEDALTLRPGYRLASLIHQMLALGIRPPGV